MLPAKIRWQSDRIQIDPPSMPAYRRRGLSTSRVSPAIHSRVLAGHCMQRRLAAIQHGLAIRNEMLPAARRMQFRIGIDLGEDSAEGGRVVATPFEN